MGKQWGFNAGQVRRRKELLNCPDHEVLHFLEYGCCEYSEDTPPVSWFAPHSSTVYAHWATFHENVSQEIKDCWLVGPWQHPLAVPFRIIPGATMPKPRRPNACRNIFNRSVPGPRFTRSAASNGRGLCGRGHEWSRKTAAATSHDLAIHRKSQ